MAPLWMLVEVYREAGGKLAPIIFSKDKKEEEWQKNSRSVTG
jgi:hypothetical protein